MPKKQSNDAAVLGALVGGLLGATSAPSHASGGQVFAQGLLGAVGGAAGMAALESVLNGSTKSKASAKQPVNKAVSELAQPPIMKLKKESVSQSQTLKENPKKTLSSAIDDQPKKKAEDHR